MSRDDDPRLTGPVSAGWVLVQLAGMRFINSAGTDAYDYMKRSLLAQPLPKPSKKRAKVLTPAMLHVLYFAVQWDYVVAGSTPNPSNRQVVKINPAVMHALASRGLLELDTTGDGTLRGKITAAGGEAWRRGGTSERVSW